MTSKSQSTVFNHSGHCPEAGFAELRSLGSNLCRYLCKCIKVSRRVLHIMIIHSLLANPPRLSARPIYPSLTSLAFLRQAPVANHLHCKTKPQNIRKATITTSILASTLHIGVILKLGMYETLGIPNWANTTRNNYNAFAPEAMTHNPYNPTNSE